MYLQENSRGPLQDSILALGMERWENTVEFHLSGRW